MSVSELSNLLIALQGIPVIRTVHFNVIKRSFGTNTVQEEIPISLEYNDSLYDQLIRCVPLWQWKELQNGTRLGTLNRLRVTRASHADDVKSIIDTWAQSLFFYGLTQVVTLNLKV